MSQNLPSNSSTNSSTNPTTHSTTKKTWDTVITSPSLVREQWLSTELAVKEILAFERRFGTEHLILACHAALPLIVTPELVNLIRINFLDNQLVNKQISWLAEADFLLSSLVRPLDDGLFEVEPSIREVLLVDLEDKFGRERQVELAQFLQFYLERKSDLQQPEEITRTQLWIAQAYTQPDKVIAEITALRNSSLQDSSLSEANPLPKISEQIQFATTLEILAEPLQQTSQQQEYQYLLHDSRVISQLLYGEEEELEQSDIVQEAALLSPVLVRSLSQPPLQTFEFEVATVEVIPAKGRRKTPEINIVKRKEQAQLFIEKLPNDIILEMVSISGGKFLMGSPETEEESSNSERPQHEVTVPPFFMGKYPITQAQWRAVATLPQVNCTLKPDPSGFKGDDLPVETISWDEAVEFCDRISKYTGKNYRLPSEAEWEYACRGGTTTPFHFGETITPELANYNGEYTYGSGTKGENKSQTTPVGSFKVANAFGLFDMHGNVWERCLDDWHDSYKNAPKDGSAWLNQQQKSDNDNQIKMLRGGSWILSPEYCRSASRDLNDFDYDVVGFRVVFASVARIL
jgi:formylglycine-generating enzyme required for sulfatase activity